MVLSPFEQHLLILTYWVLLIPISAFLLRQASSLFTGEMPTYPRAILMVLIVAPLAYLVFEFTSYVIMLSMQDVSLRVPPGYGFSNWLREPFFLKWHILNMLPFVRFLPFIFALCAAGMLQVAGMQLTVKFRLAILVFLVQWVSTLVAMFVLAFVINIGLGLIGRTLAYAPTGKTEGKPAALPQAPHADTHEPIAEDHSDIHVRQGLREAAHALEPYWKNLKHKLNPYLEEVRESCKPFTRHLPASLQHWLDEGTGWWWVFGALSVAALCWLFTTWKRLMGLLIGPSKKKKKKKKRRTKVVAMELSEDIEPLGMVYTELGERQLTVKGLPARLRLVVMAAASRDVGELHEDMVDRLLDWIKPGLSQVAAYDVPRIRIWPPQYSTGGFGITFAQNVRIPEAKGERSNWALVSGMVTISKQPLHVGMAFLTDEPSTLRHVQVGNERWLDVVGVKEIHTRVGV